MGVRSMVRITKTVVDALQPGEQIWDREIKGFGARRQKGRPHYFFAYKSNGRRRWLTLGEHGGQLTADMARKEAEILRGLVSDGGDPAKARDEQKAAGTMAELVERYIADYALPRNKASTVAEYRCLIRLHILPKFGPLRVDEVSSADVARWHSGFKTNRMAGNRALALLKSIFSQAEKWGLRTLANPARGIEMYPEKPRERLLTAEELGRLGSVLTEVDRNQSEHPSVVACIRLLVLTGARLSEILKLKWDYVDFEHSVLRLPDSKTGPKTIPLGAPALALLSTLKENSISPWVLPGLSPENHFIGIQHPWRRMRVIARLQDVRIHDLRHAFASVAAMAGDSLLLIGRVLGHRQTRTTERYAHLADDPVRAVADRTSRRIAAALSSNMADAQVLPLGRNT